MANDNTDFDRLLAGEIGVDDPEWGRVASFLGQVQNGSEPLDVVHLEATHLDRVRASLSAPGLSPRARRRRWPKTRRLLVGGVAGVLIGLGAGAGVAAAFGVDPVESIVRLRVVPIVRHSEPGSETLVSPTPGSSASEGASGSSQEPTPSQRPEKATNSQSSSTSSDQSDDSDQADESSQSSSTHGSSSSHPTPHSSQGVQHGNSSEAPGHNKATAEPATKSSNKPSAVPSAKKTPSKSQRDQS